MSRRGSLRLRSGWVGCVAFLFLCGPAAAQDNSLEIIPDIVYGHKDGMALTFDVIRPAEANGAAVLFLQSGGWYSPWNEPKNLVAPSRPLLDKGFTVLIVRHGSAPKYTVPEAIADVRRCVRFVRAKAADLKVDAARLGVLGGSAGGHLSLMLATTGDDGDPRHADPILRQSSRVAAVVALYPPTDLRGWVKNPPEEIAKVPALKPPLSFDEKLEPDCSPLLHVSKDDAAILMIHGDKDLLVPISHSQTMQAALEKAEVKSKFVTIEGAAHGFNAAQNREQVLPAMVGWFEEHLNAGK